MDTLKREIVAKTLNVDISTILEDVHPVLKKILTKKEYKALIGITSKDDLDSLSLQLNCDTKRVNDLYRQAIRKIKVKDNYFKGDF